MEVVGTVMAMGQNENEIYPDHKILKSSKYPKFDGLRLDTMTITAQVNYMEDLDNLITYLQVCKGCFWRPKQTVIHLIENK